MTKNILLVGCGNMGFALVKGWLECIDDLAFHVIEPSEDLRERAKMIGANALASVDDLQFGFAPTMIFLAVKPQMLSKVAPLYSRFADRQCCIVSVAAGVTISTLSQLLGSATPIIRCMPNTPASIGEGMMVSFASQYVTPAMKALADRLLASSGDSAWIEHEEQMDAVTAISGSGPAYVFHFVECLSQAAHNLGLPAELGQRLALQTVAGAGRLAMARESPASKLREQVTSPGGTTAAALAVFMEEGRLASLVDEAATAARDRGVELGCNLT